MKSIFGKRLILIVLLSILAIPIFLPRNAAAASLVAADVLDNDNGAINSSQNEYHGTWNYGSYSGDYNGDHRLSSTANGVAGQYVWRFGQRTGTRYFYAYLNHPNFTDPSANYYIWQGTISGGSGFFLRTYNQHTAPGGWNKIYDGYTGYNNYSYFMVSQSSGSASTGADGAEVDYYQ